VRVFWVNSDVTFNLQNITVATGGGESFGGGIYNNGGTLNATNSTISGNYAYRYGGGIFNNGGTLNVMNSTFSGNSALNGGGIFNDDGGSVTLANSIFSGNGLAGSFGGGIFNLVGDVTLTNSTFSDNRAARGGGIFNDDDGSVTLADSIFSSNTAGGDGGGITNVGGAVTVTESTFSDNSAPEGGGIYNYAATLNVTDSTFSGNSADYGGGILNGWGMLSVANSAFSANNASYSGGGIYTYGGTAKVTTVTNSTFSGNSADGGGGIFVDGNTATVTNSTFWGNSATANGGGITNLDGTLNMTNSTFARNNATLQGGGIFIDHGMVTVKHVIAANNIGGSCVMVYGGVDSFRSMADDEGCFGNQSTILLGTLGNYGGSTQTVPLLAGSDGIDWGYDELCVAAIGAPDYGAGGFDQRGVERPQGAHCDIGAYEYVPPSDTTPPDITPNIVGTPGLNGWYVSDVALSWTVVDEESEITSTSGCDSVSITSDQAETAYTCQATSAGGTSSQTVNLKRDATAPTLNPSVSPNPVVLNGSATASVNASDTLSGIESASCDAVNKSSVGSHTVNCTTTDYAGNNTTASAAYNVIYNFTGFTSTVDNPNVLNIAKAGQTIPLKFRITDANGVPVTNLTSVNTAVSSLSCASRSTDVIEEYASGNSGLQNLGDGYYQWNWKTPTSYANLCKKLQLDLGEGLFHTALFQFKK
jgi:hypothetical protein